LPASVTFCRLFAAAVNPSGLYKRLLGFEQIPSLIRRDMLLEFVRLQVPIIKVIYFGPTDREWADVSKVSGFCFLPNEAAIFFFLRTPLWVVNTPLNNAMAMGNQGL
jgi:hypothetical protein